MSKMEVTKLNCPKCDTKNSNKTWKYINVSLNPEFKEKVLNQSLFKFKCSNCGYEALLDYSLNYQDDDKKLCIYYVTNQQELDEVEDLLNDEEGMISDTKDYKNRIVCSQEDLIEKIVLEEEQLDDRIVEIIKVFFYKNVKSQKDIQIDSIRFCKEDGYVLRFLNQGFEEARVMFDKELYDKVKADYIQSINTEPRIDFDWAVGMLMGGLH